MNNSLLQIYEAMGGILGGIIAGIVLDFLGLFRLVFFGRISVIIIDILLAIIVGALFAATLLLIAGGDFTFYMLASFLAGIAWEKQFPSRLIKHLLASIKSKCMKPKNK